MAVLVEHQIADDDLGVAGVIGDPGAAQQRPQPQHHFLDAERFGDVIVAAGGEAGYPVLHGVLGGEQQQRKPGLHLPQPAQHIESAHVRQHHVQHHHVRRIAARQLDGARAVSGGGDIPAFVPQRHRHQLGQHGLVVDDEHLDRPTVGTAHHRTRRCLMRRHISIIGAPVGGICANAMREL